jgi:hypothetical protein
VRISLAAERVDAGGVGLDVHGGEEVLEAVVAQVPWGAKSGEGTDRNKLTFIVMHVAGDARTLHVVGDTEIMVG